MLCFNRKKKPRSRLRKTQSVSDKTENYRRNKKRRRGNSEKRLFSNRNNLSPSTNCILTACCTWNVLNSECWKVHMVIECWHIFAENWGDHEENEEGWSWPEGTVRDPFSYSSPAAFNHLLIMWFLNFLIYLNSDFLLLLSLLNSIVGDTCGGFVSWLPQTLTRPSLFCIESEGGGAGGDESCLTTRLVCCSVALQILQFACCPCLLHPFLYCMPCSCKNANRACMVICLFWACAAVSKHFGLKLACVKSQ